MARIYYQLVAGGVRTLEQVPQRWRDEVAVLLEEE